MAKKGAEKKGSLFTYMRDRGRTSPKNTPGAGEY